MLAHLIVISEGSEGNGLFCFSALIGERGIAPQKVLSQQRNHVNCMG